MREINASIAAMAFSYVATGISSFVYFDPEPTAPKSPAASTSKNVAALRNPSNASSKSLNAPSSSSELGAPPAFTTIGNMADVFVALDPYVFRNTLIERRLRPTSASSIRAISVARANPSRASSATTIASKIDTSSAAIFVVNTAGAASAARPFVPIAIVSINVDVVMRAINPRRPVAAPSARAAPARTPSRALALIATARIVAIRVPHARRVVE
mmetsp:Transcript_6899/g.22726  ORF Transcript_6899/g.22726 Transcript_6899/m.22726 type:complete len:215 (-) Transcript_6899:20-664(-)